MLRTPIFDFRTEEELLKICQEHNLDFKIAKLLESYQLLQEGAAIVGTLNIGHRITDSTNDMPLLNDLDFPYSYGVCDNPEQVLNQQCLHDSEREFFISFYPIFKSHQSQDGGWRWHKWGKYIGTQNPQHEYLYDEKDIEMVFVFEIHEFLESKAHTVSV